MTSWTETRIRRGAVRTGLLLCLLAAVLAMLGGATGTRAQEAGSSLVDYDVQPEKPVAPRVINLREIIALYGPHVGAPARDARVIPLGRADDFTPAPPPDPARNGPHPLSGSARSTQPLAPTALRAFDGLPNQPALPPDGGMAVGPNHIISAGNSAFTILNKTTGQRLATVQYAAFFSQVDPLPGPFDPRVDFDPESGRFYNLILNIDDPGRQSRLDIAVSQSSDPLGSWFLYSFNVAENSGAEWMDYPTLGYNAQALFVGGNTFTFPLATASFRGGSLRIFDKQRMLNGQSVTPTTLTRFNAANGGAFTVQPATCHDPGQTTEFMVEVRNGALGIYRVTNALVATPTITFTFAPLPAFGNPPGMAQSGSGLSLDGGDVRMGNFILKSGQLWGTSGIGASVGGTGRGQVRVYQLAPTGLGTLQQVFTVTHPTLNLHYPSLDMDGFGNILLGFSCANNTINVSSGVSLRPAGAAEFTTPIIITPGTVGYNPGGGLNRWGDYSDTQFDPSDPAVVWTQHELAVTLTTWKLRVHAIRTVDEQITVVSPNGGEAVRPGDNVRVRWQVTGFTAPGDVRIDLSLDGGVTFPTALTTSTPNDGEFTFVTPMVSSNMARVRVRHLTRAGIEDTSDANFGIVDGELDVLEPNGGESYVVGRPLLVRWSRSGSALTDSPNVRIELSRDDGATFSTLAASTPNDGQETFTTTAPATDLAFVRITTLSPFVFTDDSDDLFSITEPAAITLVSPNGGELLPIGESGEVITWRSSGFAGNVRLELSRDGGVTFGSLIASTPNDGSAPIVWPGPETALARLRISKADEPGVSDLSNGTFNLVNPTIAVRSPAAGQSVLGGGQVNVLWDTKGVDVSKTVAILLSRDGGASFPTTLASNSPNDGNEVVTVPGPPAPNAVIRVLKEPNPAIRGDSGVFRIANPDIQLTAPNGGETLEIGSQFTITWAGSVVGNGTVTIQFSSDGRRFSTIVRGTPNDGAQTIRVNLTATRRGIMRILWDTDAATRDDSNRTFNVVRSRRR